MASGARWRRLIEAKAFRTNGSSIVPCVPIFWRITQPPPKASRSTSSLVEHLLSSLVEHLLSENPQLGHSAAFPECGSLSFPKTPFVVPYCVRDNVLEILRRITTPAGGRKASNRCRPAVSGPAPPVVNIAIYIYIERGMARA
jgi:hypothetical protein